MRQSRKDLAFDLFYGKYQAAERYNHILKAVKSCVTFDQLHVTYEWGFQTLEALMNLMNLDIAHRYGYLSNKGYDIFSYIEKRIELMEKDLKVQCNRRDNEIACLPPPSAEEEEKEQDGETQDEDIPEVVPAEEYVESLNEK